MMAILTFWIFLPDFVIAASDDDVVVLSISFSETNVFVGFGQVVKENVFDISLWMVVSRSLHAASVVVLNIPLEL